MKDKDNVYRWDSFRKEVLENFTVLYKATGMTSDPQRIVHTAANAVDVKTGDMTASEMLFILGELGCYVDADSTESTLHDHILFPMELLRNCIKERSLTHLDMLRYIIRDLVFFAITFDEFYNQAEKVRQDHGPVCVICDMAHGSKVPATYLVPRYVAEFAGCIDKRKVEYVPVCSVHFDGWFEDCQELQGRERKLVKPK